MILGAFLSASCFTELGVATRFENEALAVLLTGGLPVVFPAHDDDEAGRFLTGVLTTFLRSDGGT